MGRCPIQKDIKTYFTLYKQKTLFHSEILLNFIYNKNKKFLVNFSAIKKITNIFTLFLIKKKLFIYYHPTIKKWVLIISVIIIGEDLDSARIKILNNIYEEK